MPTPVNESSPRDIAARLVRMGIDVDELPEDLSSLNKTAVYRELSLIYWDLSDRVDDLNYQKAKRYEALYEDSWQDVALALSVLISQHVVSSIRLGRA